ncbi:MAG: LysM peptidoglycan-binding domain-containing protein [Clostridia bacterium]|nr:LysM peptidoglycan-binding domain-containing protein [Clostridia bacterium]
MTITQGQTIADIQLQNLLSRNTLQTANPAVDLDTLEAGQTICVPTENIACQLPPTYTLAAGETLEAVAMRFNLPLGSLLRVNPCLAPQDFEEGVTVILPR